MNIVDIVILGVIGLSILWGFYRGFIQSVLSMGACIFACVGAVYGYPILANAIQQNDSLIKTIIHYTDALSRIGDLELAQTNIGLLAGEGLADAISKVNLPVPLGDILSHNITTGAFLSANLSSLEDYVSHTVLNVSVNILSFLVCFAGVFVIASILINLLRAVFRFPLLKQFDWVLGGIFGALRGVVLCYAAFVVVPLVLTVVPIDILSDLISESALAAIFNNGSLILSIMNHSL